MSNKLSKQLYRLNQIKPDLAYVKNSREILMAQINRGIVEKESGWFSFVETPSVRHFLFVMTQPVTMSLLVILSLVGGSFFSVLASEQSKPGDTLYIAKKISERAQFAVTFDEAKKTKLNLAFAANRAEEIKQVSAENKPEKEAKVAQLTSDIQNELAEVQTRIQRISKPTPEVVKVDSKVEKKSVANIKSVVKSANIEKDKAGVSYYDPQQEALEKIRESLAKKDYVATAENIKTLTENIDKPAEDKNATSTQDVKDEVKATSTEIKD